MSRTFDPMTLATIPHLSGLSANNLAERLRTAAAGVSLTPPVQQALARLVASHDVLRRELGDRLPPEEEKVATRAADLALDAVYSGISDWCKGFSKLPDALAPGVAAKASRISMALFPNKLAFTRLPFQLQWSESQVRLEVIQERGLDAVFAELGGTVFLTALRQAHENYGRALGITQELQQPERAEVRQAIADFRATVSRYVVQVIAFADAGGEQEGETARKLLQPLTEWPAKSSSGKVVAAGEEASEEE